MLRAMGNEHGFVRSAAIFKWLNLNVVAAGVRKRPGPSASFVARARGEGSPRQGEQSRHAASQRVGIGPRGAEQQGGEGLHTKFGI